MWYLNLDPLSGRCLGLRILYWLFFQVKLAELIQVQAPSLPIIVMLLIHLGCLFLGICKIFQQWCAIPVFTEGCSLEQYLLTSVPSLTFVMSKLTRLIMECIILCVLWGGWLLLVVVVFETVLFYTLAKPGNYDFSASLSLTIFLLFHFSTFASGFQVYFFFFCLLCLQIVVILEILILSSYQTLILRNSIWSFLLWVLTQEIRKLYSAFGST